MIRFLLSRLLTLLISLVAASLVVFMALEVIPGDPATTMLGMNATPDAIATLRAELGLDQPGVWRYLHWVTGMMQGDFGQSYTYRVPVAGLIADRAAVSLPLAVIALILSVTIALPAGIIATLRRGKASATVLMGAMQIGIAVPNFWFAMLLVLLFALMWPVLPAGGFPGWGEPVAALRALILPALALALPQAAILARVLRSALIEVMGQDQIRTARAKGLTRTQALLRHGLRNALIPVLTILAMQCAFLIAGAIIIENVFYLPGLGRLIFQAITQRDLIVVESSVMLLVIIVTVISFLTDLCYALIDPRLRRRA